MVLDVGNIERIDDPTDDQIADRLRILPIPAPFAILSADDELYIQTTPADGGYRVELRQGSTTRFAVLTLGQVESLFKAFRRWDEPVIEAVQWKHLTVWNDPYRGLIFLMIAVIVIAAVSIWSSLR